MIIRPKNDITAALNINEKVGSNPRPILNRKTIAKVSPKMYPTFSHKVAIPRVDLWT